MNKKVKNLLSQLLSVGCLCALTLEGSSQITVPAEFEIDALTDSFGKPVGMAFALDGRLFVAEQKGFVWIVEDGFTIPTPFIDLREEVNGQVDRGMLGIALDPDFLSNRFVYLLYTVDPTFGKPDESGETASFARLTRYQGSKKSGGYVADPKSRTVLIGELPSEGFPACWSSHTIGSLRFALDGTLFVSSGDGARFDMTDAGGNTNDCFTKSMFGADEDIGAFRSQYLDSLGGKILRIDPTNGNGLSSNPFWNGNPQSNRSRVWAYGLRNPYRFCVRPDSPLPGSVYIGDVGWNWYEEVNVATGGENFGWPCKEGPTSAPNYPSSNPIHSGCDSLNTESNPGPVTYPVIWWNRNDDSISFPQGILGRASIGGVFHEGNSYPAPYRGGCFIADFANNWIKVLKTDQNHQFIELIDFSSSAGKPIDFAVNPQNGQVCFMSHTDKKVYCIRSLVGPGDVDRDGDTDVDDLGEIFINWGPCAGCQADLDGNGVVDVDDLGEVFTSWSK